MSENKGTARPNNSAPFKYPDRESFGEAVSAYFEPDGNAYFEGEFRPTMTGLALHLGMDRRSLINYGKREKYGDIVAHARLRVEECLERKLYGNTVTGVIFNLKNNFGWKDKNEVEYSEKVQDDGTNEW